MSGFIEEVAEPPPSDVPPNADQYEYVSFCHPFVYLCSFVCSSFSLSDDELQDGHNMSDFLQEIYGHFAPGVIPPTQPSSSRSTGGRGNGTPQQPRNLSYQIRLPGPGAGAAGFTNPLEAFLQQVITNMVAGGLEAPQGMGGRPNVRFQGPVIEFPFPLVQLLHGNPGDYAWGSGGLDAVITQLLNNLDPAGPPPMPADDIKKLAKVEISEEQVSKNLQCSVCMEDFVLKESVRQLPCSHIYHNDCIIPWLEMHGTCPICRKVFGNSSTSQAEASAAGTANPASTSGQTTTSSTSTSTSTSSPSATNPATTNNSGTSGRGNTSPSRYFDLNEYD